MEGNAKGKKEYRVEEQHHKTGTRPAPTECTTRQDRKTPQNSGYGVAPKSDAKRQDRMAFQYEGHDRMGICPKARLEDSAKMKGTAEEGLCNRTAPEINSLKM